MARAKYELVKEDYYPVTDWLRKKLFDYYQPFFDEYDTNESAKRAFNRIDDLGKLKNFCEKYLSTERWVQLKNVIRSHRKRNKNRYEKVQVTLDYEAWSRLSYLAQKKGVTLSQYLVGRLDKDYNRELLADESL